MDRKLLMVICCRYKREGKIFNGNVVETMNETKTEDFGEEAREGKDPGEADPRIKCSYEYIGQ